VKSFKTRVLNGHLPAGEGTSCQTNNKNKNKQKQKQKQTKTKTNKNKNKQKKYKNKNKQKQSKKDTRDIEKRRDGAAVKMVFQHALGVLNGHLPAGEGTHPYKQNKKTTTPHKNKQTKKGYERHRKEKRRCGSEDAPSTHPQGTARASPSRRMGPSCRPIVCGGRRGLFV
jgi:hypothetical protein